MTDFNQKTHDTDVGSHGGQSRQMMEVFENQEFGSIRLLQEAGKTFFCASDVAKALGYVNPYAAVKRHCRGPLTKREGVVQKVNQYGDAGEQVVEISFITEGDVYRLIVHSKLPSAERFEHWVFDEVLPSIRKHGVYMSDSILDQVIQHPEVIYTLAQELVAEREQLEGIEKEREGETGHPAPAAYGRYNNVILTDTELSGLKTELPDKWEYYIDRLSCHIASTGKQYHSHAATIYKWAQEDAAKGKAAPKQGIPDYSCKEGESL